MSDQKGGSVSLLRPPPNEVDFACPDCGAPCKLWPNSKPMCAQHAEPSKACKSWGRIVGQKDDLARFLIKAGLQMHLPPADA